MSDFVKFSRAVHDNIKDMSKGELYVADIGGDELWDAYLKAFPEGSDPIYRTNTTHTCSCCKSFIRGFGNVVSIKDGVVRSIWGTDDFLPYPYDVVATALHQLVLSRGVKTIFRTNMRAYGAETTKERLDNGSIMVWEHFHGQVAAHHYSNEPDTAKGNFNTALQVFRRGLEEITVEALIQIEEGGSMRRVIASLEGDELDWVVAYVEGFIDDCNSWLYQATLEEIRQGSYHPTRGSQGDDIIDREHISTVITHSGVWLAYNAFNYLDEHKHMMSGRTRREAAMRCYATSRLGPWAFIPAYAEENT